MLIFYNFSCPISSIYKTHPLLIVFLYPKTLIFYGPIDIRYQAVTGNVTAI